MIGWARRHPLAALLPVQALLYFWNLGLLSPWMDEAGTLLMVRGPLPALLRFAAADVHPPLYYLLLYGWQRIPLGLDYAVQARALSVILALLGTVALARLWRPGLAALALWTFSPCLLLYARMCRSYSLQALWAILATAFLLRCLDKPARRGYALLGLALLGGLYTHYALGIALIAAANLLLWSRRRWRQSFLIDGGILVGYLPWIWKLAASIGSWGSHPKAYTLTGSSLLEIPVKAAYWAMSFTLGEAVPDAVLVLGVFLVPAILWVVFREAFHTGGDLPRVGAILALIGFIGVARWVSYPFVPARLLFVLPFFLVFAARRRIAVAALLAVSAVGIVSYFQEAGFRNKQYPIPIRAIAGEIRRAPGSIVLVDSTNSDPIAMEYALGTRDFLQTNRVGTEGALARALADPNVHTIWFLRNTHDVSPEHWNAHFDSELRARMSATVHSYEPYTPLERRLLRGGPQYFQELVEYRR